MVEGVQLHQICLRNTRPLVVLRHSFSTVVLLFELTFVAVQDPGPCP